MKTKNEPRWNGNAGRPINSVRNLQRAITSEARKEREALAKMLAAAAAAYADEKVGA